MMMKSRFAVFALQQRLSRRGIIIVLAVFGLGYLLYLNILLSVTLQEDWMKDERTARIEAGWHVYDEVSYPFESYFKESSESPDWTINIKPYLIPSETVFLLSLFIMVLALTLAHVTMRKGCCIINRLPLPKRSVFFMQWLSDFFHTVCIWLSHLAVIFMFNIIYMHRVPIELAYSQNLYSLFAFERYLYLLFPVLNPIAFIRMIALMLSVSFLPAALSSFFEDISVLRSTGYWHGFDLKVSGMSILLIGLILLGYYESGHLSSIITCSIAMIVGILLYKMEKTSGNNRRTAILSSI